MGAGMSELTKFNCGHGHVRPNSDGSKARCGGPGICQECSREAIKLAMGGPWCAACGSRELIEDAARGGIVCDKGHLQP